MKMVYTAHSSTLYVARDNYLLELFSHTEVLVSMFLFMQLFLQAPGALSKHYGKQASPSLEIATLTVRHDRNAGKANLNMKAMH